MKRKIVLFIATAGGFGYSPLASGTAGTAVALPFAYMLLHLPVVWQAAVLVLSYIVFSWAAGEADTMFGKHDPGQIVCDEVIGYWVTLFALPPDAAHLGLGFLLFRFFDIVKPFPAGTVDKKVGGGQGVMLDDVIAGIYANICVRLILSYGVFIS